jgi:uncharacterized membrane protein SirB2
MSQIYLAIKHAHIGLVGLSGALFAARGLGVLAGAAWPMQPLARRLSVTIDVLLLAAGITLWSLLGLHPLHHSWLGTKLVLLLLYIVLGSFALKRAPTRASKTACLLAALALLCFMASVALAHHPAGGFARFSAA